MVTASCMMTRCICLLLCSPGVQHSLLFAVHLCRRPQTSAGVALFFGQVTDRRLLCTACWVQELDAI